MDEAWTLIKTKYRHTLWYVHMAEKWGVTALVIGVVCGVVGAGFSRMVEISTAVRGTHPWLLYCLPLAGIVIAYLYSFLKVEGKGTDDIISAALNGHEVDIRLFPAIFISTVLTHLCGGSAGREGAALQIGGTLSNYVGRLLKLNQNDSKIMTRVGMAAFFSALFGTPLAAALFGTMMVSIGAISYLPIFPALIASLVAAYISGILGGEVVKYVIFVPAVEPVMMAKVCVLAVLCAIVSIMFIDILHLCANLYWKYLPNRYVRIVTGGVIIIALTKILGTTDYNGAGMNIIERAVMYGDVHPTAFFWKMVFTALTLEAGYKGGEVVPSFFIGATFGCVMGHLLGIPSGLAAAIGMIGVFGAVTNSMLSPIFLSVEIFGGEGVLFFAMACVICYLFSGYKGLYSNQRIVFSKIATERIDANPNKHRTGDCGIPEYETLASRFRKKS